MQKTNLQAIAYRIGGTYVKAATADNGHFTATQTSMLRGLGCGVDAAGNGVIRIGKSFVYIEPRNSGNDFELAISNPLLDTLIKFNDKPISKLTSRNIKAIVKQAAQLDHALTVIEEQ